MQRSSSRTALALASVALLALAACGDDDDSSDATSPAAATAGPTTTAAGTDATTGSSEGGAPAAASEIMISESSLGPIIVDANGMTLYMFKPDDGGPSTCTDRCLEAWPALAGPVTAGEGVDESLLGTANRPDDGSEQATYNGWPLYYFIQDAAAGDVNGQGSNDVWFVMDATGTPVGMETTTTT